VRTQRVEFLEFVESDLRHVRDFYASWQFDGARKFQDKFRETISWIEWNPELFPRKYKYFRRAIIRRTYLGFSTSLNRRLRWSLRFWIYAGIQGQFGEC
jgi:hypothetical protein